MLQLLKGLTYFRYVQILGFQEQNLIVIDPATQKPAQRTKATCINGAIFRFECSDMYIQWSNTASAQERIKPTVIAPQALTSQDQNVAGPDLQQIPRVEFNVESEVARFV
jgi:hypothetical protein